VRHLLAVALAAALWPAVVPAGDQVGSETCKACHPAAYAAWRESPHARAEEALPERSRGDRRCRSCHAPAGEAGLAGVGCEACHGPGRLYAAGYVMRDAELARALGLVVPGEKGCLACHGESTPSLQRFEYSRKVKLIQHGEPGAAAGAPTVPPGK
jgi:hypothetical protein